MNMDTTMIAPEDVITPSMLETNPEAVLSTLSYCNHNSVNIEDLVNEEPYDSWFSNMALSLCYLVGLRAPHGNPNHESLDTLESSDHPWYGCHVVNFDQDLGINIFDQLLQAKCNIQATNYYGECILDCFGTDNLITRFDNNYFREHVVTAYNRFNR